MPPNTVPLITSYRPPDARLFAPPVWALNTLACALAMAFVHGVAQSQTHIVIEPGQSAEWRRVERGANGTNARSGLFSDTPATPGESPSGYRVENFGVLQGGRHPDGTILAESIGGNGGHGLGGWGDLVPQRGGSGGAIDLNNAGVIRMPPVQGIVPADDVVRLVSRGGKGGDASYLDVGVSHGPADGGAGGSITFTTTYDIQGNAGRTLVSLMSEGGLSGQGGWRTLATTTPPTARGGSGGAVRARIENGAVLRNTRADGAADQPVRVVQVVSQGGRGQQGGAVGGFTSYPTHGNPGGDGGQGSVFLDGTVSATGSHALGVLVSSRGGAGGEGGMESDTLRLNKRPGDGGAGGRGGPAALSITAAGLVETTAHDAPAILVESLGGDGGRGGDSKWFAVVDVGAPGGAGGGHADAPDNPSVHFRNDGRVSTAGDRSVAVTLQSVGGQGGNGTHNAGGYGGPGGTGGRVLAENSGLIQTAGKQAYGMFAQSVGGTGGRGGDGSFSANFGGGGGGNAGYGGDVVVDNRGRIVTSGDSATAVVAQSVGGGYALGALEVGMTNSGAGGGDGGSSWFFLASKGGTGGSGGRGGNVRVDHTGHILTEGHSAMGVLAQSVGGGGGVGGSATSNGLGFSVSLGGHGGLGGNGGLVTMGGQPGQGRIETLGENAVALFAQSVGGRGGVAGGATASTYSAVLGFSLSLGGSGGSGGHGGDIRIDNDASLETAGTQSHALLAQTIGGGGGHAGSALASSTVVSTGPLPSIALDYALGGDGGTGGRGGAVAVNNRAHIATHGEDAVGILAQSVGGGGGNAGSAGTVTNLIGTKLNIATTLAMGGRGAAGGDGGAVSVAHGGQLTTDGQFSTGLLAMSVGGGGGRGGAASTSTAVGYQQNKNINDALRTLALASSVKVDTRLGGSGGRGGRGGDVSLTVDGGVHTVGSNATGVVAQSVGGGGGQAGGFSGGGNATLSAEVSVGGSGGSGGAGGRVGVSLGQQARVVTEAAGSHAVFAQSVGGGGGMGGSYTGKVAGAPTLSLETLRKLMGEVLKYYDAKPEVKQQLTEAEKAAKKNDPPGLMDYFKQAKRFFDNVNLDAARVLANSPKSASDEDMRRQFEALRQSDFYLGLNALQIGMREQIDSINKGLKADQINVPNAGLTVSVGGTGGSGGEGGAITLDNQAQVATAGDHAHGVLAQSVGGGGGAGGGAYSTGSNKINATVAVGGSGATAGRGGEVSLTNSGVISTGGKLSYGVLAQSVGGGGGLGGVAAAADAISLSAELVVGGSARTASAGGKVSVNQHGVIRTQGDQSHAVVAQSVGGGGGVFFVSPAQTVQPAAVRPDLLPDVKQAEEEAYAALNGLFETLGIEQGGSVEVNRNHTILPSPAAQLKLGGRGGGGGAGGHVSVTHGGHIETHGKHAYGIFAQSVGGGGGMGGHTGDDRGLMNVSLAIGGEAGAGGIGGDVRLDMADGARIETHGDGAIGALLQSVGGGGGHAGSWSFQMNPGQTPIRPFERGDVAAGQGGNITVNVPATGRAYIHTRGTRAHGLFAQSVGGGGGLMADEHGVLLREASLDAAKRGKAMGTGGRIDITMHGDITAEGEDAYAIVAQSGVQAADGSLDSSHAGGDIRIHHDSGMLLGGSGQGAAVFVDGGRENVIHLGSDAAAVASSGMAIKGSFGADTVNNHGVILGGVDLLGPTGAGGVNRLHNHGWMSTSRVKLGAGGQFVNDGILTAMNQSGHPTVVVEVDGDFVQTDQGMLLVDVSPKAGPNQPVSDYLAVSGSVDLRGVVWSDAVTDLLPGEYPFLGAGGQIKLGELATPSFWGPHVPIWWEVKAGDQRLLLVPQANFAGVQGVTLTDNQRAVANHLQQAWDQGLEPHAGAFARFLDTRSAEDYARTLDSLSPEGLQVSAVARMQASRAALTSVQSCPAFRDDGMLMREGDCVWGRVSHSHADQDRRDDSQGYRRNATSYRLGVQRELAPGWFAGVSAAYTHSRLRTDGGLMRSTGGSVDVAFALKREIGNWTLSGSLALGQGRFDNRRSVVVGGQVWQAESHSKVYTVAGRLRAAYQITGDRWYVSPRLDLDVIHTRTPSYQETGAGSLALQVASMSDTLFAVRPAVEFGGRYDLASGGWVRPYANVGVTFMSDDALRTRASLAGSAGAGRTFTTATRVSRVLGDVGVGVQVKTGSRWEFSADYQAQLGRGYTSHQGTARMSRRF